MASALFSLYLKLLVLYSPFFVLSCFIGLSRGYTVKERKRLAWKVAAGVLMQFVPLATAVGGRGGFGAGLAGGHVAAPGWREGNPHTGVAGVNRGCEKTGAHPPALHMPRPGRWVARGGTGILGPSLSPPVPHARRTCRHRSPV